MASICPVKSQLKKKIHINFVDFTIYKRYEEFYEEKHHLPAFKISGALAIMFTEMY